MASGATVTNAVSAAEGVITRFGAHSLAHRLEVADIAGYDAYEYRADDGVLTVRGKTPLALCHAFYSALKRSGKGLCSWSGNRIMLGRWPELPSTIGSSPFRHRYYLNVVTFGYTTAYWDWPRWEREIDWMALHGIDMPLALTAQEAIMARVYAQMGMSAEEIGRSFVGPSHLPWLRMGNISGIDSPLPASWHRRQLALQHQILDRLRELGMTPICPAFSGQVSDDFVKRHPNAKVVRMTWGGGGYFKTWLLLPQDPLFAELQHRFITEWEREFGKCSHYLIDSFNEMDLPDEVDLASYGEKVYRSLAEASPGATWVMQGWMLGYERHIWSKARLAQLLSRVPNDRMMILDLAVDYSCIFWRQGPNWEFYDGFLGKSWVYSVIPNMGGKTAYTGELAFYATNHVAAINSAKRGNLVGFGFAPEGLENNEVIYELLSDAAWSVEPIDLEKWLREYSLARYGECPAEIMRAWHALRGGVYGSFTDHPRFAWQGRSGRVRETASTNGVAEALHEFASVYDRLKSSPLYLADLRELGALYLSAEKPVPDFALIDALLLAHPTHRLERHLAMARAMGESAEESDRYETNARRIVTTWGPGVADYSARIWSGLIRGYYAPRFALEKGGADKARLAAWEDDWVENRRSLGTPGDSEAALQELLRRARTLSSPLF